MPSGPPRFEGLPEQYFAALLARVRAVDGDGGEPLVDLGRGNPETGPPAHVIEALRSAAGEPGVDGYGPFRGLPRLREAIAARYRDVYGVEIDPEHEVAIVPGTKSGIMELAQVVAGRGDTVMLPDPYYPDYPSAVALAEAELGLLPLDPANGWAPDWGSAPDAAIAFLNYPSNPCAVCAPPGAFSGAVDWANRTGGVVVHDAAYIDLVFDGREPASFLAEPGAKEIGVETYSMSKSYGMAGWRIGFVVGNAELVERVNVLADHTRVGMYVPMQVAAAAALEGPQDCVAERVAAYERRRDMLAAALPEPIVCEGTFYTWVRLPEGVTAMSLLTEQRVVVAPGEGFGPSGAGWARLSLAVTDETLERGIDRLAPALAAAHA